MKIFKSIKSIIVLMLSILIFIIGIILYNVYDNNRIVLVKEEVEIKNLPTSFNNFKILQITDLHGKVFGKNQKNLINKIVKSDNNFYYRNKTTFQVKETHMSKKLLSKEMIIK